MPYLFMDYHWYFMQWGKSTLEDKPTVVIATGSYILILYGKSIWLSSSLTVLQTKKNQFVNVSKIHSYIGNAVVITIWWCSELLLP